MKAIILGLDGADPALLDRWCADGTLPNLAHLRANGTCGAIVTPPGLGDDTVWPSFYTGLPAGHHGRYFWAQPEPLEALDGMPFWSRLSAARRRVVVLDVPKCPVARDLNGVQLCDWLVHGRSYAQPTSWPADLAGSIVAAFGEAPPTFCRHALPDDGAATVGAFRDGLLQSVAMKRGAARQLLTRGDWDAYVAVFKEAHCATHLLWHLVDCHHPEHRMGLDERLGQPLKAVYRALDDALGDLLAAAPAGAAILVFTPVGMAANFTGDHLVPALAARINDREGALIDRLRRRVESLTHPPATGVAHKRRASDRVRALPHNEASGALRVRVAGRDAGAPSPDSLVAWLTAELQTLTDPQDGRRLVASVIRPPVAFPGPRADQLPDLLVIWDRSAPIYGAQSRYFGRVNGHPGHIRTGNHIPGGSYVVAGGARPAWGPGDGVDISGLASRFLAAAGMAF